MTNPHPPKYEERPVEGGYIVFDTFAQKPAVDDPTQLTPRILTKEAALRACARLNRAYILAHS